MIYSLSSWEKIDRMQPWLLANEDVIVMQKPKIFTSPGALLIGGLLTLFGAVPFLIRYSSEPFSLALPTSSSEQILPMISIVLGILLVLKARAGIAIRKEQGGIHPDDILLILDGSKKDVKKQIGTSEEIITSFENMQFEIEIRRNSKQNQYRIQIVHPQGKEHIVTTTTQKSSDALLQNIKTRLHIA